MVKGGGRFGKIPSRGGGRSGDAPSREVVMERRVIVKKAKRMEDKLVASLSYPCSTKKLGIHRLSKCPRSTSKHYKYDFNIPKGIHHLCEAFGPNYGGGRSNFYLMLFS
ncbi:hypothetical protein PVK06_024332 [Gossypium arboreum]|uniref:Uncharacterized protein n=1 Tax=Gossypium arboreum TaxID=29729 RepID=A0ABR0PDN2_GOSAR|nr:hypothetical protein PVK06_024332 [Gossypium arboreum]